MKETSFCDHVCIHHLVVRHSHEAGVPEHFNAPFHLAKDFSCGLSIALLLNCIPCLPDLLLKRSGGYPGLKALGRIPNPKP